MQRMQALERRQAFANPRTAEFLLANRRMGAVWFPIRLYVGWQWLTASWHKLAGPSSLGWVRDGSNGSVPVHHGDKLLAFWQSAIAAAAGGAPQIGYPWYREFLRLLIDHHAQSWFAYLIAGGEFMAGLCLVLGAFTVVAAAGGALMNFNYMLAGSASLNPMLFAAEVLLILAWKSAGYVGLDRWLLPMLGTPWQPGWLLQSRRRHVPPVPQISAAGSSRNAHRHRPVRIARPHRHGQPAWVWRETL